MRVEVDEPGRDGAAGRVDHAPGIGAGERRTRDAHDAVAAEGDVGAIPGRSTPVDDGAAADEDVVRWIRLCPYGWREDDYPGERRQECQ